MDHQQSVVLRISHPNRLKKPKQQQQMLLMMMRKMYPTNVHTAKVNRSITILSDYSIGKDSNHEDLPSTSHSDHPIVKELHQLIEDEANG